MSNHLQMYNELFTKQVSFSFLIEAAYVLSVVGEQCYFYQSQKKPTNQIVFYHEKSPAVFNPDDLYFFLPKCGG